MNDQRKAQLQAIYEARDGLDVITEMIRTDYQSEPPTANDTHTLVMQFITTMARDIGWDAAYQKVIKIQYHVK